MFHAQVVFCFRKYLSSFASQVIFLTMATISSDAGARASRKAHRSCCAARVIDGSLLEFSIALASDDEEVFFGEDGFHSDNESPAVSPPPKQPCVHD